VIELGPLTLGGLGQAAATVPGGPAADQQALGATSPGAATSGQTAPSAAAISALIDETVRLFRGLRAVADQVHNRGTLSGGRRGVLQELQRAGPRTVPQVARARSVTRQHVRALVDPLAREGLVEFADNPEHRRSRLVRLTAAGREWLAEVTARENALLSRLELDASDEELRTAERTLMALGRALSEEAWRQAERGETAAQGHQVAARRRTVGVTSR
jgi:DNA-binding MarR family transcriptional regulator